MECPRYLDITLPELGSKPGWYGSGEEYLIFTTADHLNTEYFPEPKKFDIERYSAERREHKQLFDPAPVLSNNFKITVAARNCA